MLHLINYLYHFPMSANASQMNSEVQEYHDSAMEEVEPNDLPSQILASSNTQVNHAVLLPVLCFDQQLFLWQHCTFCKSLEMVRLDWRDMRGTSRRGRGR